MSLAQATYALLRVMSVEQLDQYLIDRDRQNYDRGLERAAVIVDDFVGSDYSLLLEAIRREKSDG